MYERTGKLMAAIPLMLGLLFAMIGISNNPDQRITYDMDTGIKEQTGTQKTETISSQRHSNPEIQLDRNHEGKREPQMQA